MLSLCSECDRLLEERDRVKFKGIGIYHVLGSTIHYSLYRDSMDIVPGTLAHQNCQYPKGQPDGD